MLGERTIAEEEPGLPLPLVMGVRLLLEERGLLNEVEAKLGRPLDVRQDGPTVSLERYNEWLEIVEEMHGTVMLHELGFTRMLRACDEAPLGPALRSWIRSYGNSAQTFLHVAPHVWSLGTRGMGALERYLEEPSRMIFRQKPIHPIVRSSTAWHRFLEGFAEGLMKFAGLDGATQVGPSKTEPHVFEVVFEWKDTGPLQV